LSNGRKDAKALVEGPFSDLRGALERSEVTSAEVVGACLAGLEAAKALNAIVAVRPQAVDEVPPAGPLTGVPVVVKDCFADGGRVPTVGSRAGARWMRGTAEVLRRLRGAGAVVAGYSNLHEWMVGTTSLVSAWGPVVNPLFPKLVAGGSSGGSAAALAAGLVPAAIGTDVGGSIRIPAACCGVVGFKPTWGAVPTQGFVDDGSPIDHVGPMARSVEDVVALFEVLSGRSFERELAGALRVGVATGFLEGAHPDVSRATREAAERLEPHVQWIGEVDIDVIDPARSAIAAFILRDVVRLLAADRDDWLDVVQPRTAAVLRMGAGLGERQLAEAIEAKERVAATWERTFEAVDVVVTPTLPGPVATVADRTVSLRSGLASAEVEYVAWNGPMNLGGVPCLSLPSGRLPDGTPFNLSLTAGRGRDATALSAGLLLESLQSGATS
jgi:Asp-tRNA(Asn)/Glu-tRNA(Gln) amidotransferase A subunit family amidase